MKATISKVVVLALMGALWMVGPGAGAASASADGCTAASGGVGALNCIFVEGSGRNVTKADSIYNSGYNASNVCNVSAKFRHTPQDQSQRYTYRSTTNCGLWRGYVSYHSPGNQANQSSFCATNKNSVISSYSNYACITIKLHFWD